MRLGTSPLHRNLKIALLVAAAASLTVLLSQCRMVTDQITAPATRIAMTAQKPKDCTTNCQDQYTAAIKAENDLHRTNEQLCGTDPVCLANEEARHEAALAQIQANRKACLDTCHHQGGGSGGN